MAWRKARRGGMSVYGRAKRKKTGGENIA